MRFRILFAMLGLLFLTGCAAVDDIGRVAVGNSDEITRLTAAILANTDEAARASSPWVDDASRLSTQLLSKYGPDAGQVVSQAASRYGDDFFSQGRYIDDLVLPLLDDTDEYTRLVSLQDEEIGYLSSVLDDYQLESLTPDLLCLNLEKLLTDGELANREDYIGFFRGKLLGDLDISGIYALSENFRETVAAVAESRSSTEIYYRLRLNSMCASLK